MARKRRPEGFPRITLRNISRAEPKFFGWRVNVKRRRRYHVQHFADGADGPFESLRAAIAWRDAQGEGVVVADLTTGRQRAIAGTENSDFTWLTADRLVGLFLGFAGLVMLVGFPVVPITGWFLLGCASSLFGSLSAAFGSIYASRYLRGASSWEITAG